MLAAALAALALASGAEAGVAVYPSSQTIRPAGRAPGSGDSAIALNTAIGEREGAWIVVTGAKSVAASIDASGLVPVKVSLSFAHFVSAGGRAVPDALLPWSGSERATEKPNQPLYLQVLVPYDAKPGTYTGTVQVLADGKPKSVPLTVTVFDVTLPVPSQARGNLLTAFHLDAQTYLSKADALYKFPSNAVRVEANQALYSFLADYRISPSSWGFAEPRTASGYESAPKWRLDSAGNMVRENAVGFAAMRIPISSQRTAEHNWIAGISPFQPQTWCDYLRSVRGFWQSHDWLEGRVAYLYPFEEPGLAGQRLVARQAAEGHRCFPGSKMLMTGNPVPNGSNRFLWDNRNDDDVDIWVVLSRRYYGQFTNPKAAVSRAHQNLAAIEQVRRGGKMVWSYTHGTGTGTPGYAATEPLSNPRMFLLWNALEGIQGTLYGQGTTSYRKGNPLESLDRNGEFTLLYPGPRNPIPSARLEQIRDGIEDWDVLQIVRTKHGDAAVRKILADAGLFSVSSGGVKLACTLGCELKSDTKYSWPQWSHDASTAARIERAKLAALKVAAG